MYAILRIKSNIPELINPIPRETIEELLLRVRPQKGEMIAIVTSSELPDEITLNNLFHDNN